MSKKQQDNPQALPFFARFLDTQDRDRESYPETRKYPSDDDE